jgi:hypothetical protein
MKVPAGTTAYIGPPAKPIEKGIREAIGTELGKIQEILEAHLPQVYIKGVIDPSAQVLFVVVQGNSPSPQVKIGDVMKRVLPPEVYIDVMELHPGSPELLSIRETRTQLNLRRKLD